MKRASLDAKLLVWLTFAMLSFFAGLSATPQRRRLEGSRPPRNKQAQTLPYTPGRLPAHKF